MTREEKELKLKDICGRLPYNNTMISVNDGKYRKNAKFRRGVLHKGSGQAVQVHRTTVVFH